MSQYLKSKEYKFWYLILKYATKRLKKIDRSMPNYHGPKNDYKPSI